MYRLSFLQAVEPEFLTKDPKVLVEIAPELDGMGFPTVDLVADEAIHILDYVERNWGSSEDPQWYQHYVVERVEEYPLSFADYRRQNTEV